MSERLPSTHCCQLPTVTEHEQWAHPVDAVHRAALACNLDVLSIARPVIRARPDLVLASITKVCVHSRALFPHPTQLTSSTNTCGGERGSCLDAVGPQQLAGAGRTATLTVLSQS
jgi:hypothetical protein